MRVARFLDGLRASPPADELILVTHGGAMSVALHCLADKPIDTFVLAPLENCAVRTVILPVESENPSPRLQARQSRCLSDRTSLDVHRRSRGSLLSRI